MLKKTLTFILITVSALLGVAQNADWYKYPVFNDCIDRVVETSDKVFYLSGGNLFSFNTNDNESYSYNSINKLSDEDIQDIFYNVDKDYLLIVYTNSNIDLLYADGSVVNMPDIKDTEVSFNKGINDVAFGDDRIAVATDFGIVVFSDVRHEVIESGIYNAAVNCVAIMNGHLLIYGNYATNFAVLASPLNQRHNTIDKFNKLFSYACKYLVALDDNTVAFRGLNDNNLVIRKLDLDNYTFQNLPLDQAYATNCDFYNTKDGYYTIEGDNKIMRVAPDGVSKWTDIPEQFVGKQFSFYNEPTKLWIGDDKGVARYDISSSSPTVLFDKILPDNYTTARRVGYMRWSADGQRLYISNFIDSRYHSYAVKENSSLYQTTNVIENGFAHDVSLMDASIKNSFVADKQQQTGTKRMVGDPQWVIEDPDDKDKYYCSTFMEGLYVIKRNPSTGVYEEIGKFNEVNCPSVSTWGERHLDVNIDHEGNLWIGYEEADNIAVLPAAKRKLDPKSITKNDWKTYRMISGLDYINKDMVSLICKHSNMVFIVCGAYEKGFIAIDTKGTYDNPVDDNVLLWSKVTDQDGNSINYTYVTFLLEDNRGCVWVGTNAGVFEITNPSKATDHNMTIRRIKVPRNDGTNYADYLLDSEIITWMALDPAGRKWIATEESGIYLVSETGDKIIRHYDKSNSPLISNTIMSIECDKNDNTVYVGTEIGLYSFKSDATVGKDDFSEIYAYPNPVRPEYSGVITITGLMDNSVVKITDAAGSVIYETRSEGGMATWDASGRDDNRVRSGVYYVYASESNSGKASGAVTKILVIN